MENQIGDLFVLAFVFAWFVLPPFISYHLAKSKGYPQPSLWAFFSIFIFMPLLYLIFRKPYKYRFPTEVYARNQRAEVEMRFGKAIKLETEGHLSEATEAYRQIISEYPSSDFANDARSCLNAIQKGSESNENTK